MSDAYQEDCGELVSVVIDFFDEELQVLQTKWNLPKDDVRDIRLQVEDALQSILDEKLDTLIPGMLHDR